MGSTALFRAALLLLAGACSGSLCYRRCNFEFCTQVGEFAVVGTAAGASFTGAVCDKSGRSIIGGVGATGEARVVLGAAAAATGGVRSVAISQWAPPGLQRRFPAEFFRAVAIPRTARNFDHAGIARAKMHANQARFLPAHCFYVPLERYDVLDHRGDVVASARGTDPHHDCVAFAVTR